MRGTLQPTPQNRADVGGVVVTFNPDAGLAERLAAMAKQAGVLVVVDNSENPQLRASIQGVCTSYHWRYVSSGANEGVAAALNRGIDTLRNLGLRWALLFDQDSLPSEALCDEMIASWNRHSNSDRLGLMGPKFVELATGRSHRVLGRHPRIPWWFKKIDVDQTDVASVTMVITSGSLLRMDTWIDCGQFDDDLFIDYVDTDFCLKCAERGWQIALSARAHVAHELGRREHRRWLGFHVSPTNHSPLRHYYIARNRVAMWKRHAFHCLHWAMFDLAAWVLWTFRVVTVEEQKGSKLRAMTRGTLDGLRGRMGRASFR